MFPMGMTRPEVTFRPLVDKDLRLLHRWLTEPGVVRWWEGDDVSWDAVVRDYGSGSPDPTEHWIAQAGGRDIGWIQCYATASYPEESEVQHWWKLGVARTAGGIDYLIGEPSERGKGMGSAMIAAFVPHVLARHRHWSHLGASPFTDNVASWRALEKAGFRFAGSFTDHPGSCRLMLLDRRNVAMS